MTTKQLSENILVSYPNENSVLLEWPEKISQVQHQQIMHCQQMIKNSLGSLLVDSIVSYSSLLIYYHFDKVNLPTLFTKIDHVIINLTSECALTHQHDINRINHENDLIEIPVYYGLDAGWDMNTLSKYIGLSVDDIISLHSQQLYRAYALGFTPGFCYLGTLDEKLRVARRSNPRLSVPKGAVAIAEQQTAVYPNTSPGGWHIIGQTPLAMYKVQKNSETNTTHFVPTISVGQHVRFKAINYHEFCQLGGVLSLMPNKKNTAVINQ